MRRPSFSPWAAREGEDDRILGMLESVTCGQEGPVAELGLPRGLGETTRGAVWGPDADRLLDSEAESGL